VAVQLRARGGGAAVGRRLARKTLFATAGLVSVHDCTWTTDRLSAAQRWSAIEPVWATSLTELIAWSESTQTPTAAAVEHTLDGIVTHLINVFADTIGLSDKG
jgi:hypothetical protein